MLKDIVNFLPFSKSPVVVLFNLTQKCNLRCTYCFGKYYADNFELSAGQVERILKELHPLGTRRIGFSGGEPLLHREFDRIIRAAADYGFEIGINSNGILVPRYLKTLEKAYNLTISLDGASAEIHDRYRGNGSFSKALRGIRAARDAGITVNIACTLTSANADHIEELLTIGEKYQCRIQISPLYPKKNHAGIHEATQEEMINKSLRQVIRFKKAGADIFYSSYTYRLVQNWPVPRNDTLPYRVKGHPICQAGRKIIFIDNRAGMFACQRFSQASFGRNCLSLGVASAYRNLPLPPCKSCRWACYIEYNAILNMVPSALINLLSIRTRFFKYLFA